MLLPGMGKRTFSLKTLLFIPSILPKIYPERYLSALFHKGFIYIYFVYAEGSTSDLTRNENREPWCRGMTPPV